MKQVFIEPFQQAIPAARTLLIIVMILQTLMACNYNIIPMLFYRPEFYCTGKSGLYPCDELAACNEIPVKYFTDMDLHSIPLDFDLYCDRKKDEATILTFMMMGHLIGAFICSLLSDYGHKQRHVLIILLVSGLVSGIALIWAALSAQILSIGVLFTLWSISSELILTFINTVPVLFFPKHMVQRVFALLVCSQTLYSIFQPLMFSMHGSWRIGCIATLGVPHIVLAFFIFMHMERLSSIDTNSKIELWQPIIANPEQITYGIQESALMHNTSMTNIDINDAITYKSIIESTHFRNIIRYLFVYGGSYVAAMSSLLTLNSLSGNIYVNLTVVYIIEFSLSATGSCLSYYLDVRTALRKIFLLMGISYLLYTFLPSTLKFAVVVQGKLLTDMTWVLMGSYLYLISPQKFLPLIFSTRAIYNLIISTTMPYIKYFLQLSGVSIFVFSGIYEVLSFLALRSITQIDLKH